MASFVRESVANDDSDDNHITLSLGLLDTESDNNLENLSDVSPRRPRKSIYLPREPRWPPRRSSRESTRRSTRASISRPPTPPRSRDHNRRARRNRSPSYSPPSEQQVRTRSPDTDERVGILWSFNHYCSNVVTRCQILLNRGSHQIDEPPAEHLLPTSLLLPRVRASGTPRTLRANPPGSAAASSLLTGPRLGTTGAARGTRGTTRGTNRGLPAGLPRTRLN